MTASIGSAEHTPTPYEAKGKFVCWKSPSDPRETIQVAEVKHYLGNPDVNAEFITLACNSYDKHRDLLKECLHYVKMIHKDGRINLKSLIDDLNKELKS